MGGHVRRASEEARRAGRVLELLFEREGSGMGLPAGGLGLERLREVGTYVQPAVPRPTEEPLDRPATANETPSAVTSSGTMPADW